MDAIKSQIQEVHNKLLGRNLDSKTLNWWANCINNNVRSLGDLEKTVLESDEYIAKVGSMYKDVWYEHMCNMNVNEDAQDDFVEKYIGQPIDDDMIFKHISEQPEYDTKHISIINSEYNLIKGTPIDVDIIQFYLAQFKSNRNYTVKQLSEQIKNDAHILSKLSQINTSLSSITNQTKNSNDSSDEDIDIGDTKRMTASQSQSRDYLLPSRLTIQSHLIDAFEGVYGRPMYIQEYFKYVIDQKLDEEEFQYLFIEHTRKLNELKEIYKTYTGKEIDEYKVFVSKHLNDADDEYFIEKIIDNIVNSPEYERSMKESLFAKYKSLFDEELEAVDIVYLFNIIKKMKLSIVDDNINRILSNFKEITDDITTHIFRVFLSVLERQPDIHEVEQHIVYYRDHIDDQTMVQLDECLENKLMNSLEYHDILKTKIKIAYKTVKTKDILPSTLFGILNQIIPKLDVLKNSEIDATITSLVHS